MEIYLMKNLKINNIIGLIPLGTTTKNPSFDGFLYSNINKF